MPVERLTPHCWKNALSCLEAYAGRLSVFIFCGTPRVTNTRRKCLLVNLTFSPVLMQTLLLQMCLLTHAHTFVCRMKVHE